MPIKNIKLILAPMAGFSDQPFRRLSRSFGADEVVTELVSSNALVQKNRRTHDMARLHDEERPASVQIFGSNPDVMAEAARMVEATGCAFIDINMGCPARKVTKNGAGAKLLNNPELAGKIFKKVVSAVKTPVSVKIRTGKDSNNKTGLAVAMHAAENGVKRITIHARSVADSFSGPIDYDFVNSVKKQCPSLEVVANGGIKTLEDARLWMKLCQPDGLMIGRGALGHPSIFNLIKNGYTDDHYESIETVMRHVELMEEYYGPSRTLFPLRGHLMYYSRGLLSAKKFRTEINLAHDLSETKNIIDKFFGKQPVVAA